MPFHPWYKNRLIEYAKEIGLEIVEKEYPEPGDVYLAGRNTGPHLLTCLRTDVDKNFVVPVERCYCFDIHECVVVR